MIANHSAASSRRWPGLCGVSLLSVIPAPEPHRCGRVHVPHDIARSESQSRAFPRSPCRIAHLRGEAEIRRASVLVVRSEEHTSELQSLMRISYAVFCLKKKKKTKKQHSTLHT